MAKKLVAIIMGSRSDAEVMSAAAALLEELRITYETRVISAHRQPKALAAYVESLSTAGFEAVIAGAGKAAHLPGVVASLTALPVIGVPISNSELGGLDALLSIAQMPSGVPVATMGINGAKNASLTAARILALKYDEIKKNLLAYIERQSDMGGDR